MSAHSLRSQKLEDFDRHIAEAQRQIEDLGWRIAAVEQAGGDASAVRDLLRQFRDALAHLIASRDALQREMDESS